MKICRVLFLFVAIALFVIFQPPASGQSASGVTPAQTQATTPPATSPSSTSSSAPPVYQGYHRPTEKQKLRNYAFDSFGPYAILGSAVTAAYQQADKVNSSPTAGIPPDWGQGWDAYGQRVGSNFGINLITQTARYSMAEVFREDTLYYPCECTGFFPRLGHALISTVTARRGDDGHRTFSFSSFAAPYAGTEAATLLWYPSRYNAMDGFRMGNYNLAIQGALNVALEFIWGGPHTLLSQHHVPVLSNAAGLHPTNQP